MDSTTVGGGTLRAIKTGNVVTVSIGMYTKALTTLQNKRTHYTQTLIPKAPIEGTATIIKDATSPSSAVYAAPFLITTDGNLKFNNIGGFSTIGATTANTYVSVTITYIV